MIDAPSLEIARRYITALSSGVGPEGVAEFLAPDVLQEEFPNRLLPNRATRDLQALKQARARGQALLSAEQFDIVSAIGSGEHVAMELRWAGTIAQNADPFTAGQQLRARFAVFLEFRGGRIVRQRNYDCFDPW